RGTCPNCRPGPPWPAGAAGPAADSVLQHQLLLLLPPRPTIHPANVGGDVGPDLRLDLQQRPGSRALHPALARRRALGHARLLLRDSTRTAEPPQRRWHSGPPVVSAQRHADRRRLVRLSAAPKPPPRRQRGRPRLPA